MSDDLRVKVVVTEYNEYHQRNDKEECILPPSQSQLLMKYSTNLLNSILTTLESNGIQVPELVDSTEISIKTRAGSVTFQLEPSLLRSAAPEKTLLTKPKRQSSQDWAKLVDGDSVWSRVKSERTKSD